MELDLGHLNSQIRQHMDQHEEQIGHHHLRFKLKHAIQNLQIQILNHLKGQHSRDHFYVPDQI